MSIGFTGTQIGMTHAQNDRCQRLLKDLDNNQQFHHGDCVGADAEAAFHAHRFGYFVVCHPPLIEAKRAFTNNYNEKRHPDEYIARNHAIVDESDVLIACPQENTEQLRSGTWATVRYARKTGKRIFIIYPDGVVYDDD